MKTSVFESICQKSILTGIQLRRTTSLQRLGFTLVELLVTIAIIGLLIAMLLPGVQMVREASKRTSCSNKLRQQVLGIQQYESAKKKYPAGLELRTSPRIYTSWMATILPYIDQQPLWELSVAEFQTKPIYSDHETFKKLLPIFACNSDQYSQSEQYAETWGGTGAPTSYLGINGTDTFKLDGVLYYGSKTNHSDISDGLSHTLAIGERPPLASGDMGFWYGGTGQAGVLANGDVVAGSADVVLGVAELVIDSTYFPDCPLGPYDFVKGEHNQQCDGLHFWSFHPGGGNFALCDGSVHFVAYSVDQTLLNNAASRNGSEAESPEW